MLHQFGHELRRHAPLLLAWCVLLGLHLFLSGSRFVEEQSAPGANGAGLIAIFVTAAVFLPFLLVPLIVQADAPLDENAFWATRPLRGTSLFGGKLLLVGLFFILLPLAVEMAILALRGGGSRVWLAAPEFLFVRGAITCVAFAAATLARCLDHAVAILGCLVLLAVGCLLAFVSLGGADAMRFPRFLLPTRILLFGLIAGAGGLVAAWVLYRDRRVGRGAALSTGTVALATLAMIAWPWDLLGFTAGAGNAGKEGVSWEVGDPVRLNRSTETRTGRQFGHFHVPVNVRGIPDGVALPLLHARATFGSEGETSRLLASRQTGSLDPMGVPVRDRIRSLFPGLAFGEGGHRFPQQLPDGIAFPRRIEGEDLRAFGESRTCEVSLRGTSGWFTFEVAGELPLRKGARWSERGEEIEIASARASGASFGLTIRTRELRQIYDRERAALAAGNRRPWALVAVYPARNQAVWIEPDNALNRAVMDGFSPLAGALIRPNITLQSEFGGTPDAGDGQAWLDEARLVILRPVYHGTLDWDAGTARHPLVSG